MIKSESIGQRIRRRRKDLRLTQASLGSRIGLSGSAISQWEDNKTSPNGDSLISLSRELQCSPEFILYGEDSVSNVELAAVDSRLVPIISYVQAGAWTAECTIRSVDGGIDFLQTNLELSASAFALVIKGKSMLPDFSEGDTVIIDPDVIPIPGDFVVAKNGQEEAIFKKYRPRGVINGKDVFELTPLNDDYPTVRSDETPIRIIGTMIEHRRYRRKR
ncbi:LexA family protein [Symbiopectobacterium purcellii]|uniref:Helix-turn-helix domain-containing protein n=1 Tax=Symbiopectobacterium purcellii TaxID=2871826 RepID=A0ABX9ARH4_9ENTR|nr:S24 family peptidase [Symbiopectobacterium purcellii]QZN97817.1 helix-turn-helix domain-containing protein [Symbiopectobacterium purcellii]